MRRNCIVCENPIHRTKSSGRAKLRRAKNNVTCNRRCSRIYIRISTYQSGLRRTREKKNEIHER